jgi:hypothetical protein
MEYDPRDLSAALAATAEPVRQELAVIDREIQQLEGQLKQLKNLRQRGRRVLGALGEPDGFRPGPAKGTPLGRTSKHHDSTAPETQQKVLDYVRRRFPNAEFTGPEIHSADDAPASHGTITRALRDLHESGDLRLVRLGGEGRHNRERVYRLLEGGTNAADTS